MERFDKFFLPGKPYLDKVIVNITPDMVQPDARPGARRRADAALRERARPTSGGWRPTRRSRSRREGYEGIGPLNWLAFNLTKKPLSDVQVRKAIATAIDKNFVTKALMAGFATPADGPIVAEQPLRRDRTSCATRST